MNAVKATNAVNAAPLSRVALFAAGCLLAVLALEVGTRAVVAEDQVLRWHDYGAQLKVEQLDQMVAAGNQPAVVIAGTSMAQQALVPEVLMSGSDGQVKPDRYYNAALNGGVPVVMERWLLDQVVPRVRPQRVIWGLSSIDFSANYGQAGTDAYQQASATRPGALAEMDRLASSHSRFVASRAVLRNPSALWGSDRAKAEIDLSAALSELGAEGERQNFEKNTSDERAEELAKRVNPYALDADDIAAIVRTVDALRQQGVEVTFVELPVPPRLLELYPNGAATHNRFQTALGRLADELNVERLAPADGDSYGDEDFVDFTHLSEPAARRFSEALVSPS